MTWQTGFVIWTTGAVVIIVYNAIVRGPRTWRDIRRVGYPPLQASIFFILCLIFGAMVAFLVWPLEVVASTYIAIRRRGASSQGDE